MRNHDRTQPARPAARQHPRQAVEAAAAARTSAAKWSSAAAAGAPRPRACRHAAQRRAHAAGRHRREHVAAERRDADATASAAEFAAGICVAHCAPRRASRALVAG